MSVKDKKKKEKKRQEALQKYGEDISKRPKGVSKREWIKAREQEKATGNLPTQIRARQAQAKRSQFISPLASNLSPQARQQADNIIQQLVPKSPFQTPTNASFAPRQQLSPQEKIKADSIIAQMGQSQFGNLNLSIPAPITYAPKEKEAPKDGFWKTLGKGIAQPLVKAGLSTQEMIRPSNIFRNPLSEAPSPTGKSINVLGDRITSVQKSGEDREKAYKKGEITREQLLGGALTDAIDLASVIPVGKAAQIVSKSYKLFGKEIAKEAIVEAIKTGSKYGVGYGAGYGISGAMEQNASTGEVLKTGVKSGAIGGIFGGALGLGAYGLGAGASKIFGKSTPTPQATPVQKKAIADLVVGKQKETPKTTPTAPKMTSKPVKVESDIPTPKVDDIAEYVKNKSTKFREPTAAGDNIIRHARELSEIYHDPKKRRLETKGGYLEYSIDKDSNEFIIDYVEATEKRKGIGTRLMNAAEKIAEKEGLDVGLVASPQDDVQKFEDLKDFYESLGYENVAEFGDVAEFSKKNADLLFGEVPTKSQKTNHFIPPKKNIENENFVEGDDLVSQAQKMKSEGKSFDEFMKAQEDKMIHHGTFKMDGEFSPKGTLYGSTKEGASTYGSGRVESFLPKEGRVLKVEKELMPKEWDKIIAQAKKDGYDFVEGVGTDFDGNKIPVKVALDSEKSLVSKSQLLDIWNKANTKSDHLIQEAKKYNSAEELRELGGGKLNEKFREIGVRYQSDYDKWWKENIGDKVTDSYQMSHRPTRTGATADNVSQEVSDMGLPDFYEHPEYYHFGGKEYDESVQALRKIKGKPDAEITIYRASPKGELRSGDWVTLSKEKARLESLTEKTSVHSFKVKVKDVEFAGDDITEFGYWGKGISQEKFRVKDDLAKVGIKITDDQEKQIIKLNKSMFGDENIKITEQILTPQGQKALGSYRDGLIKIVKGEADIKDTYYHESFHKYLDVLTTADEQIDLLREARSVSGIKDIAEVEEWLSESFIKYAKNREGVTGKLKAQFDNILERVKSYFGNEDKIKKAYSELISGKKKAAKTPIEILQNEGNLSQTGTPKVLAKKSTQQEVQQSLRKDNITKNLSSGNVNDYSKAKKSIENTWRTAIREWGQDKLIRVKKLIDSGDIKVDEHSNPYLKESLMHGRISTRLDSIKHQITKIDKSISVNEKIFNDKALQKDIDRYLIAKHAPERNKALGEKAAGMTDNEASQILAELGTNPKRLKLIEEIGNKISTMNKQTLEILKDGGVIDDELFTTLTTKYKNHIPLNRIMDETDDIAEYLTGGRGINVKSTGIKRAKGSEREVSDILTNVTANLEQAVVRSEKNRVAQSVLKLARDNKMVGGLFEEIKPRAIGESFDGKPLLERINDPLVMTIRENGKPVYLKINDKNLAEALQGVNIEQLGTTMRTIGWFTRMYSGLMTRFNPEFAFSNVIRDMQENMVYASSKEKMGITGALKIPTKTVGSTKNIVDFMRGKKTAGSNLYKQMLEDGGSTGGMSISTKKQLELDINKIRKLNRSNPRKAAEMVINGIDNWNQIFEDANRLSAYKVALDRGYSREMAASIAKESTINFNRKGTAGSFINSLYMFSNASIQGSTKMLQALKNPKTAVATATAVGVPVVLANQWNDSVDPQWRDKVSEWDRQSNLVVMLPSENGDANYVTIPVGWGIKPIMATVNVFYDISQGTGKGLAKEGGKILTSIIEGYNPAGGTDLISAITPTPLDTPSEIARNKSWSGSMIRPDWKEGLPKTEQNFDSLKDKATGRVAINTAEFIRDKTGVELNPQAMVYALEAYIGGAGKTVTKTGNFLTSLFKGEDLAPQETPVVSRFYKEKPAEELQTRAERNAKNEFFKSLKKYETGSDEQKKAIQEYVISKPEEERQGLLFQIRDLGFDTKGITSSEDIYKIKPKYDEIQKLYKEGKQEQAEDKINALTKEEYTAYKRVKSTLEKDKNAPTEEEKYDDVYSKYTGTIDQKYQEIQKLRNEKEMTSYIEMESRLVKEFYEANKNKSKSEKDKALAPYLKDKKFITKLKAVIKEGGRNNLERDLANMGVRSGERANAVWEKIKDDSPEEQKKYLQDLYNRDIISKEVLAQLQLLRKNYGK